MRLEGDSRASVTQQTSRAPRILLIEDERSLSSMLIRMLSRAGLSVEPAFSLQQARQLLRLHEYKLIVLDLSLPDAQDTLALETIKREHPSCPVIIMSGRNEAEIAVRALRRGAINYLVKPVAKPELLLAIEEGLAAVAWAEESDEHHMIGRSRVWLDVRDQIAAAGLATRTTVLLSGEPGVGKELCARAIHEASWSGASRPLVIANVACFSESLVESELFGHQAGAFTGAISTKRGLFELADHGTLFLDEIGELPQSMQAKLLRVLEGHGFRRVGGEVEISPQFRLITATNRNLEEMVARGEFRADLYHRLKVFEIKIPPLRERGKDIERLARHFISTLSESFGWSEPPASREFIDVLLGYAWPGNVRELRNVIERSLIIGRGRSLTADLLPPEVLTGALRVDVEIGREESIMSLDDAVRMHIEMVLERCGGNISEAARRLGITRQTLRRRLGGP